MTALSPNDQTEFDEIALKKLTAVLGGERGKKLLDEYIAQRGSRLETATDLYAFSQTLSERKGFEGAVGAMLGVTAIIRGASPSPSAA